MAKARESCMQVDQIPAPSSQITITTTMRLSLGILALAVSCTAGPIRGEIKDGIVSVRSENYYWGGAITVNEDESRVCWAGHIDKITTWGCSKEIK